MARVVRRRIHGGTVNDAHAMFNAGGAQATLNPLFLLVQK